MAKGFYLKSGDVLYKVPSKEAKRILRSVIKGETPELDGKHEVAPVIDLGALDAEGATKSYMQIEMGGEKE